MDMVAVLIVMGAIFIWGVVSARVTRADLSAPIVFVAIDMWDAMTRRLMASRPSWSTFPRSFQGIRYSTASGVTDRRAMRLA